MENEIFFCTAFSFVRCINLSDRPEQWNRFRHHIRQIGSGSFLKRVERFDAVDGRKLFRQALDEAFTAANDTGNDKNKPIEIAAAAAAAAAAPPPPPLDDDLVSRVGTEVAIEWDTTQNSLWDKHVVPGMIRRLTAGEVGCALSHVSLWKDLVKREADTDQLIPDSIGYDENLKDTDATTQSPPSPLSMLIFEDDAAFFQRKRRRHRSKRRTNKQSTSDKSSFEDTFLRAFRKAHTMLPDNWDLFYLGFSDRGERRDSVSGRAVAVGCQEEGIEEVGDDANEEDLIVQIFRPTYGFHTHAYAIRQSAAEKFLQRLPVVGPIDVWLADNQWFGLNVYCAIIANEGWKNTGAPLVGQDRSSATASSVGHSGR